MSELTSLFGGYGDLLLFVGMLCSFYGIAVAFLERKRRDSEALADGWYLLLLGGASGGAVLLWLIEPVRYLWGAAALGLSVSIVTVVGLRLMYLLTSTPIGGS